MSADELTCVTGYWSVKNKHGDSFKNWFANTLNVDHPYVVFCDKERAVLEEARQNFLTTFVNLPLEQCYLYPKRDKVWTHETHCPSPELNVIWNEKIFLLQRAANLNCYQSEWFLWLDAGICIWRQRHNQPPLRLNRDVLRELPKNKFIFSSSMADTFQPEYVVPENYYHHVAGTSFLIHRNVIDQLCFLYSTCLEYLLAAGATFIDQVVMTYILVQRPDLFYKLAHGYGSVAAKLFL